MSIFTNYIKNKICYYKIKETPFKIPAYFIKGSDTLIDTTTSVPTDHRSLGQVVTLAKGRRNPNSDAFSSQELHEQSRKSLASLKQSFNL